MALDTERSVEMMQKSLRLFSEDMNRAEKASKGVAENVTQLGWQMQHGHRSFMEYVGHAIKLPNIFREGSMALIRQNHEIASSIKNYQDQQRLGQALVDQSKAELRELRRRMADPAAIAEKRKEANIYKELVKEAEAAMNLEGKRLDLKKRIEGITGKELAVEFLMLKGFADAIRRSGQVNEALMTANSLTKTRNELTDQIYEVQAKTGASLQTMLAASKALTSVWPKARSDFKSTLEVVVEMEEGLGVSVENSTQLARVFQINLGTPVREVADRIAVIANSTSLAADEATRFATEIGKALRLLGPGAATGAREVAGYVTMMAARMKDVNGDANEIIKMFSEMSKGTSQGFMLRGLSGVNSPGAMGTQAGAQQAMQGIGRMIDRIVTAAPGTSAYVAQLEAAAQVLGTTTETVVLYRKMLEESKKPLDEHAKLQQRWREQTMNANAALGKIRESFVALIQRALLPLIPPITWVFNTIAKLVSFLASNRVAVTLAGVAVGIAIGKTVVSLYRLSAALYQVAMASEVAAKFQMLRRPFGGGGIGIGGGGAEKGIMQSMSGLNKVAITEAMSRYFGSGRDSAGFFKNYLPTFSSKMGSFTDMFAARFPALTNILQSSTGWLQSMASNMGGWFGRLGSGIARTTASSSARLMGLLTNYFPTITGFLTRSTGLLGGLVRGIGGFGGQLGKMLMGPQGLAIVAAGAAGWAVGKWIDKRWPNNWIAQAARAIGEATVAKTYAGVHRPNERKAWEVMADVRKQMIRGDWEGAERTFRKDAWRVEALKTEKGAQGYINLLNKTASQVREQIALSTVTSAEQQTHENDLKMIEAQKQMVKNTGGAANLLKEANALRKASDDFRKNEEQRKRMEAQANFRMIQTLQDESMASKKTLP